MQYGRNGTAHAARASVFIADEGSLRRTPHECVVRVAYSGPDGLPLGSAMHFHNVAIAMHPVHQLQIRLIVHN